MRKTVAVFLILLCGFVAGNLSQHPARAQNTFGAWSSGGGENLIAVGPAVPSTASNIVVGPWIWTTPHTLKRFHWDTQVVNGQIPANCTTTGVVAFFDETSTTALSSLTMTNTQLSQDSGAISVATTAGHTFSIRQTTASAGCTTFPNGNLNAVYQ